MNCKRCGASWKLGNISPKIDSCPVCDINFRYAPDYREFETIVELLQFLITQYGVDYWSNARGINGYLNDYFPEKTEIRNKIKFLLEKDFGKKIAEWYLNNPNREDIIHFFQTMQFQGDNDNFIDGIMFLVGASKSEGTDIESPIFYKTFAQGCLNIEYKIAALEKAVRYGADDKIELELTDLKMSISDEVGLNSLQNLAERGNVNSLLRLAKIYEQGKVVERDYSKVIEYLNKAVLNNSAEGMFQLGRLYLLGWGVLKTKEKAIELFEKASEQNHVKANYQLYFVYYNENVDQKTLAIEKLKVAAEAGYLPAMYEYALHLLYGEQVSEDIPIAISLLESCALQGNVDAIEKLRYIYSIGYKVPRDKMKALEWQDKLMGE